MPHHRSYAPHPRCFAPRCLIVTLRSTSSSLRFLAAGFFLTCSAPFNFSSFWIRRPALFVIVRTSVLVEVWVIIGTAAGGVVAVGSGSVDFWTWTNLCVGREREEEEGRPRERRRRPARNAIMFRRGKRAFLR